MTEKFGKVHKDAGAEAGTAHRPPVKLSVVRTMTMPGGKKIRVMRKDAFDRSIKREVSRGVG